MDFAILQTWLRKWLKSSRLIQRRETRSIWIIGRWNRKVHVVITFINACWLSSSFDRQWNKEVQRANNAKTKPSLLKTIRSTFIRSYSIWGLILFIQGIILRYYLIQIYEILLIICPYRMIQPIILANFIQYFNTPYTDRDRPTGWTFAVAIVSLEFLNILINHHCGLNCQRIGMRCRIACCSLIYRKVRRVIALI